MEWIKAKYDRLLLGVFGIIAVVVGGLLVMKEMSFRKQFPVRPDPPERNEDKGSKDSADKLAAAEVRLKEPAVVKPPVVNNVPVSLFVSAPVIKLANASEAVPIFGSEPIRPPIANEWFYQWDLDITRADIAQIDSDGDFYSNTEEFLAKTNPKDKTSTPPFWAKLTYVQCVEDPLTLRFNTFVSKDEMSIRRTEPSDKAFNVLELKVGSSFPVEKNSPEMRFQVVKVDDSVSDREVVYLDDLLTKNVKEEIPIRIRESLKMPSLRAKVICSLGKEEEIVVAPGGEFSFAVNPDFKFTAEKVTQEEVEISFTPPGETEKKTQVLKISSPP